jgi:hypothetical protein
MSSFYSRVWELTINDKPFIAATEERQFRIVFDVLIDFGGSISYADIAIYNLSIETANIAFKKGAFVGLRAGYVDNIDSIFKGRIVNIFYERSGPDTITRIVARGGTQPDTQSVNTTLGAGVKLPDIIRELAKAIGYPLVIDENDFANIPPYIRGKVLYGDPRVYLDQLAETHKFTYTIDNDRIIVVGNGSFRKGSPVIISEFTGMEGIPEITEVGADVIVRLTPSIRIGGRIDIQSKFRTFNFSNVYFQDVPASAGVGIYRVFRLNHTGDNYGDTWSTKVTGFR